MCSATARLIRTGVDVMWRTSARGTPRPSWCAQALEGPDPDSVSETVSRIDDSHTWRRHRPPARPPVADRSSPRRPAPGRGVQAPGGAGTVQASGRGLPGPPAGRGVGCRGRRPTGRQDRPVHRPRGTRARSRAARRTLLLRRGRPAGAARSWWSRSSPTARPASAAATTACVEGGTAGKLRPASSRRLCAPAGIQRRYLVGHPGHRTSGSRDQVGSERGEVNVRRPGGGRPPGWRPRPGAVPTRSPIAPR